VKRCHEHEGEVREKLLEYNTEMRDNEKRDKATRSDYKGVCWRGR
jgi:hypothetical protein